MTEYFEQPVDEVTRISTQLAGGHIHDETFRTSLRQEGRHTGDEVKRRIDAAVQLAYAYDRLANDDSQEPDNQVYFNGLWRDAVVYAANLASSHQDYFFATLSAMRTHDTVGTTGRIVGYLQENAPAQASQARSGQKAEKPAKLRSSTTDALRRFGRPVAIAAGVVASSILAPHTAVAADNSHTPDETKNTKVVDKTPGIDLNTVSVGQLVTPAQQAVSPAAQKTTTPEIPKQSSQPLTAAPAEAPTIGVDKPPVKQDTLATVSTPVKPTPEVASEKSSPPVAADAPAAQNPGSSAAIHQEAPPLARETVNLDQLQKAYAPALAPSPDAGTASALVTSDFKISGDQHTIAIDDLAGAPSTQNRLEAPIQSAVINAPNLDDIQSGKVEDPQIYTPPSQAPLPAPEVPAPQPVPAPAAPAPSEQAPAVAANTPEAIVNPALAGETKWTTKQLEQVKNNLPVYLEAQHQTGVPWEILAAVHQREHGLAVSNPANGQGVYQLFSADERFAPGDISHDEFLRQTILAAKFIQAKAQGGVVKGSLTLDNPDKVKDVLFSYNGRAAAYVRQASDLGFTLGAEGSPYVMNLADDRRNSAKNPAWGQILTDGGPLGKANHEVGAWPLIEGLVHINTVARAQTPAAAQKPAETVADKAPEHTNDAAIWERPTDAAVSSPFGGRGEGGVHHGIDYATPTGTQLKAAIGGKVTVVVMPDVRTQPFCLDALNSIGASVADIKDPQQKEVRITTEIDGDTYTVIYAHMSKVTVAPNQIINPGDAIGETGASGCVTGPHLHFEVRKNGVPIDPTTLYGKPVSTHHS